jgi:hypothetical protein
MAIEHVQVLTTVGSEQEAELIASSLVEAKLAACVQIAGPIRLDRRERRVMYFPHPDVGNTSSTYARSL